MAPVLGQAILAAGYAIVSVNDRLSGEAKFPAAVQDVKAAVRYVRAHAATCKLDPARFAVFGALQLGNASVSSAVKVVVEFFGPNDFPKINTCLTAEGCKVGGPVQVHASAMSSESVYLGGARWGRTG